MSRLWRRDLSGFDRFCAWNAYLYPIILFIGWWVFAGFMPLHQPTQGAEEIAAIYDSNRNGIRIGMIVIMWTAASAIFFGAIITKLIAWYEGGVGAMTVTSALANMGNVCLTFYPPMWWAINAFRGDRSPELVLLLNDAAWLQFLGGVSMVIPLFVVLAIVSLKHRGPNPLFPRWVGYYNIWVGITFVPDQAMFFFKTGPFAWNGLIAIWLPLTIFVAWYFILGYYMLRALRNADRYLPGFYEKETASHRGTVPARDPALAHTMNT
jgi:hypothetical protein